MSFSVNFDANNLFANNQLGKMQDGLASSLEKISSGRRINKAADDASGMMISNLLRSQANGMEQALRNVNDSVSLLQIADGALGESTNLIQNIREKAIQAANGSQTTQSRTAIQADISNSLSVLHDITQNTSYNGQKLLSGEFANKSFQVGAESYQTIDITIDNAESHSLANIDVTTAEGAQLAIQVADEALMHVDNIRANVGATQNKATSTASSLSTAYINTYSSESTIADVDIAEESINLSKMDALTKAGIFARVQGNAASKSVLSLLGGMSVNHM